MHFHRSHRLQLGTPVSQRTMNTRSVVLLVLTGRVCCAFFGVGAGSTNLPGFCQWLRAVTCRGRHILRYTSGKLHKQLRYYLGALRIRPDAVVLRISGMVISVLVFDITIMKAYSRKVLQLSPSQVSEHVSVHICRRGGEAGNGG